MPAIHVRLTDEQHEQLRSWALTEHRSMQQEVVHRLFPAPVAVEHGTEATGGRESARQRPGLSALPPTARDASARPPSAERGIEAETPALAATGKRFQPDFKQH